MPTPNQSHHQNRSRRRSFMSGLIDMTGIEQGAKKEITLQDVILYGWALPVIVVLLCYLLAWRYEMLSSYDSFAGFGYFVLAPAFLLATALLNMWIFAMRNSIRKHLYLFLLGLVIPLTLLVLFHVL